MAHDRAAAVRGTPAGHALLSVLAAAALAAAFAPAPAAAADSRAGGKPRPRASVATDMQRPERTLRQARALFQGTHAPRRGVRHVTPVLTKLALSMPSLSGARRKEVRALLARPRVVR